MNIRYLKGTFCAVLAAAALSLLAADPEWKWDTSERKADDVVVRTVVLAGEAPYKSATFAVDAGAFCEALTGGCDFDSTRVGGVIYIR